MRAKRIANELKEIQNNPPPNWKILVQGDSNWDCWITADNSSPYYGNPFLVKITFPQGYPLDPVTIKLGEKQIKRFYHPNISSTSGAICEKTIQKNNASLCVRDKIEAFLSLLSNPNPDDPYNSGAAKLYAESQNLFYRKARLIFLGL